MTVQQHPEQNPTQGPQRTVVQQTNDEAAPGTARHAGAVARVPGSARHDAGRSNRAVTWIGWHLGELTGIAVPVVLAVSVHSLWMVPAAVVAATWAANELRLAHRGKPGNTPADRPADAPVDASVDSTEEVRRNGLA